MFYCETMSRKATPVDAFNEIKKLLEVHYADYVSQIRGPILESLTTRFIDVNEQGRPSRMVQRRLVTVNFVWTEEV